jgi:hypothetical protein
MRIAATLVAAGVLAAPQAGAKTGAPAQLLAIFAHEAQGPPDREGRRADAPPGLENGADDPLRRLSRALARRGRPSGVHSREGR